MPSVKPLLRAGRKAMQAAQPRKAIAHLAQALAIDPGNLEVADALGHAFRADGQHLNALRAFDPVLSAGQAGSQRASAKSAPVWDGWRRPAMGPWSYLDESTDSVKQKVTPPGGRRPACSTGR